LDCGCHGGLDGERDGDGDADRVGKSYGREYRDGNGGSYGLPDSLGDGVDVLHGNSDGDVEPDVEPFRDGHSEWDSDGVFEPHGHQIGDALRVVLPYSVCHGDGDGHRHGLAGFDAFHHAVFFVHALLHGRPDGDAHHYYDAVSYLIGNPDVDRIGNALLLHDGVGGVQRNSHAHGLGLSNVLSDVDEQFDALPYRVADGVWVGHSHGDVDGDKDDHGLSNVDRERDAHAVYVFGDGHENGDLHRVWLFYGFSYGNGNGLRDAHANGDEHSFHPRQVDRYGDDDAFFVEDGVVDGKRNAVFVEHGV
jgi:hypothetical protein